MEWFIQRGIKLQSVFQANNIFSNLKLLTPTLRYDLVQPFWLICIRAKNPLKLLQEMR